MERAASRRRRLVAAGERVDALAILESLIRPDRFRDQDAAAYPGKRLGMKCHDTACTAEPHLVAILDIEGREVVGMDENRGPPLPFARGRGFVESRVEEGAGRTGRQPEGGGFI